MNGEPANGTLDWSANVTLTVGENMITVIATDGARLNTTAAVTVRYEPLRGDLNSDGSVTSADAAIALRIAVGSRPFDDAADVSGDGSHVARCANDLASCSWRSMTKCEGTYPK